MELAIDTASGALSVALIDRTAVVAEHHAVIGRGHAETIVGVVATLVGARGADVTGIVVGTGPGSFTGARIGIAAARAFGLGWRVPVAGVSSLALVAAGSFARDPAAMIVVAVADAGSGHVYWQTFDRDGPLTAAASALATAVVPSSGATLAGTGLAHIDGHWPRSDVTHPRAADVRWLPATARGAPVPVYLDRDLPTVVAAA